jgi:hypothetical protein
MKEGSGGGLSTQTGRAFEAVTDLANSLEKLGYELKPLRIEGYNSSSSKKPKEVWADGELKGLYLPSGSLYKYLQNLSFDRYKLEGSSKLEFRQRLMDETTKQLKLLNLSDLDISQILSDRAGWRGPLSSRLIPDEAFLNSGDNTLYILEKKMQKIQGSVDEKLQTFAFKRSQYARLLAPYGIRLEYTYVLSFWFQKAKYKDVLRYMTQNGQKYWIQTSKQDFSVPLSAIGLN